jgi:hypothetical protein
VGAIFCVRLSRRHHLSRLSKKLGRLVSLASPRLPFHSVRDSGKSGKIQRKKLNRDDGPMTSHARKDAASSPANAQEHEPLMEMRALDRLEAGAQGYVWRHRELCEAPRRKFAFLVPH